MIAGCKHLMQSLLLFRCHLLKTEGPVQRSFPAVEKLPTLATTGEMTRKTIQRAQKGETARVWQPAVRLLLLLVSVQLESRISRKSLFTKNTSRHLREAQKCFHKTTFYDFATAVACLCFSVASRLIKMHHIELFRSMRGS